MVARLFCAVSRCFLSVWCEKSLSDLLVYMCDVFLLQYVSVGCFHLFSGPSGENGASDSGKKRNALLNDAHDLRNHPFHMNCPKNSC